jgi:hypothetical protein
LSYNEQPRENIANSFCAIKGGNFWMAKNIALDSIVAKFAHDMASPLGGVMMAMDMLDHAEDREQSLHIIQDAVQKMRVMLTLWRTIFSLSGNLQEEEATFLSAFQDYIKNYNADITILMARPAAPVWQVRAAGILLLCLSDRLGFLRRGTLSLDHHTLIFQADYDKGDLFDRIRLGGAVFESMPLTRQALPHYLHVFAKDNGIQLTLNEETPFRLKLAWV